MRKRINFILLVIVISVLFTVSALFGQWIEVCIDPGHGGPGASKYGPNGDGQGHFFRLSYFFLTLYILRS